MWLLKRVNNKETKNHNLTTATNRIFASIHPVYFRLQLVRRNKNREVFLIKEQEQIYYIKRFFATTTIEKLKNILLNKAVNSQLLSRRLTSAGFLVAEPVLYMLQ